MIFTKMWNTCWQAAQIGLLGPPCLPRCEDQELQCYQVLTIYIYTNLEHVIQILIFAQNLQFSYAVPTWLNPPGTALKSAFRKD